MSIKSTPPRRDIREIIEGLPTETRLAHITVKAMRQEIEVCKKQIVFALTTHKGSESLTSIGNRAGEVFNILRDPAFARCASLVLALEILEASPEFKTACEILDPLQAELLELETLELQERLEQSAVASKRQAKIIAIDKAAAEARAAAMAQI